MGIVPGLVMCAVTASFAHRKGFNPLLWILGGGLLGLILLAIMPSANAPEISYEQKQARVKNGNIAGGILSAVVVVLLVVLFTMI
jgi:hypothetical protein